MADLDIKFLEWQETVYKDPTRFKVVAAGRRTGKSRLAAWLLIINALQSDKGHVFYVAPTQGQARDIMWQTLLELGHDVISTAHINNLQIKLINGSTISLKGGDRPETMRGVSLKYLVLDEYADIKVEVFEQILRPALADQKGHALFIGTPMGRCHFYDLYKYGELGEDPDFKSWHFTSFDNPLIDPAEIEAAKKSMSSYAFRQEFMASFDAMGSEMFKEEWLKIEEEPTIEGDYFIAIDLAGFEEVGKKKQKKSNLDNSSICITKVGEDGWVVEKIICGRWSLNETAAKIFNAVHKYKPMGVGIERGISKQAVSSPLNDLMKRHCFYFNVTALTHGNQKKTDRIMWALQGRFENGLITLKKGDWNIQFLDEIYQFPNSQTHDDMVDSLAYIDQLASVAYQGNWEEIDDFETLDSIAGY